MNKTSQVPWRTPKRFQRRKMGQNMNSNIAGVEPEKKGKSPLGGRSLEVI